MPILATDWATVSALVTGAGTLVLAVATFASVRSSNRSARIAEAALQEQRRPVLAQSRFDDPKQKIMFVDGRWLLAEGGRAAAEHADGIVYLAINLRNVGSGIAVCQSWIAIPELATTRSLPRHSPEENFRLQTRDLYIPAGDTGMWQGALRNPDDPLRAAVAEVIDARQGFSVELLYTDLVGRQRTISRFGLQPTGSDEWLASLTRHWYLDWDGPRPEDEILAAVEAIQHDQEAAEERRATTEHEEEARDGGEGRAERVAARDGAEGGERGSASDGAEAGEPNLAPSARAGAARDGR
jgi:hypothetical protein